MQGALHLILGTAQASLGGMYQNPNIEVEAGGEGVQNHQQR